VNPAYDATTIINTIRTLSIDAVQKANSGHPGAPMGLAPLAYTLWDKIINYNPADPHWVNRDRFVLSVGHASMLLYSILHLSGYDLPLDDLKNFRQLNSKCAGHPEYGLAPGVETTTGPLGQGAANSVGMALAGKWLAKRFNRPEFELFNYNVFATLGDGCMMEGITSEAASLAGHLQLNNLIWIYDSNQITIEGGTELAFTEDVAARFEAYSWNIETVSDVNDIEVLETALAEARKSNKPTLVIVSSHIAYGAPNKQDTASAHGAPLGVDEVRKAKEFFGFDPEQHFFIPDDVESFRKAQLKKGKENQSKWQKLFDAYCEKYPNETAELNLILSRKLPEKWDAGVPGFDADSKGVATRTANGQILNAVASKIPWIVGGSADLGPSNQTVLKDAGSVKAGSFAGRNVHFGVREHAMGAIANGMALSGLRSYCATFLIFSDYMRTSVRLASLMKQPVLFIFTHDSIGVGEDGPTHQPIEQLVSLRAMPGIDLIRPADANELAELWKLFLPQTDHPVALALTRQNVPVLDRSELAPASDACKGGYVLSDSTGTPDIILIGTGSEVSLCLDAKVALEKDNLAVRVVSLPCWEMFERQDENYQESVLPPSVKARVSIEAGSTLGWAKYVGDAGVAIGLDHFGESAPAEKLFDQFGLSAAAVVKAAKAALKRSRELLLD
jgi:transketolase